jgi:hypothetical protein
MTRDAGLLTCHSQRIPRCKVSQSCVLKSQAAISDVEGVALADITRTNALLQPT